VSCAETAELIDLPFGLWIECVQGSTSSVVLYAHWRAHWRHFANTSGVAMLPYVKLLWPLVNCY